MLGKLLKYEIKATARTFLPLYCALLIFAVINRLFIWINSSINTLNIMNITRFLFMVGYVILIIGILVLTLIVMIQRFYKNFVKDEGYLMFTLPVHTWELILSKMIVSAIWIILSTLMIFVSIMMMCLNADVLNSIIYGFKEFNLMIEQVFSSAGLFYFEFLLLTLFSTVTGILMIFASISIGSLFKNKLLAAFGAYIVIYLIGQLVMSLIVLVMSFVNPQIYQTLLYSELLPQLAIWGIILFEVIFGTVYFIASNYIFSKKLNLE